MTAVEAAAEVAEADIDDSSKQKRIGVSLKNSTKCVISKESGNAWSCAVRQLSVVTPPRGVYEAKLKFVQFGGIGRLKSAILGATYRNIT